MSPKVGTVGQGLVVHLENHIVNVIDGFQVGSVHQLCRQIHNALMIVADAQLPFGTAHSVGGISGQVSWGNGDLTQSGSDLCKCGFHACPHIRSAADHLTGFLFSAIHLQQMQFFGIGMGVHRKNFTDYHTGKIPAFIENFILNFGRGQRELVNQTVGIQSA